MKKKCDVYGEAEKILSKTAGSSPVLAALSGGADSVCLLLVLNEYCKKNGNSLSAVHINHCLRGSESDCDEHFCRELCGRYGIPLTVHRVDAAKYSREHGMSCEEGARELRYRLFAETSAGITATAHNLGDNAETVILNLARGTGLKGLCGIPPVRDNIVRPLINISRRDIEKYLEEKGEKYVTDSTNLSDDFSRNKIRHRVIPELGEINGNALENIGNMTVLLREEDEFLDRAAAALSSEIGVLAEAEPVLRRRLLMLMLKKAGITPDMRMVQRAENVVVRRSGREQMSGNIFAYAEGGCLKIGKPPEIISYEFFEIPFKEGEFTVPPHRKLTAEKIYFNKFKECNNFLTNFDIDCDKIQGSAVLRTRRQGDEIRLAGENFSRKVRKIYNARKIPPHMREYAVVIEDENGIVFAEHCGVSAGAAASENSRNILRITLDS